MSARYLLGSAQKGFKGCKLLSETVKRALERPLPNFVMFNIGPM